MQNWQCDGDPAGCDAHAADDIEKAGVLTPAVFSMYEFYIANFAVCCLLFPGQMLYIIPSFATIEMGTFGKKL